MCPVDLFCCCVFHSLVLLGIAPLYIHASVISYTYIYVYIVLAEKDILQQIGVRCVLMKIHVVLFLRRVMNFGKLLKDGSSAVVFFLCISVFVAPVSCVSLFCFIVTASCAIGTAPLYIHEYI